MRPLAAGLLAGAAYTLLVQCQRTCSTSAGARPRRAPRGGARQAARRSATPTLDQENLLTARRQRLDLQLAYEKELLKHAVEAYKEEQEAARARELVRAAAAPTHPAPQAARGRACREPSVARCVAASAARGACMVAAAAWQRAGGCEAAVRLVRRHASAPRS